MLDSQLTPPTMDMGWEHDKDGSNVDRILMDLIEKSSENKCSNPAYKRPV
jgi:hypothetical protein